MERRFFEVIGLQSKLRERVNVELIRGREIRLNECLVAMSKETEGGVGSESWRRWNRNKVIKAVDF